MKKRRRNSPKHRRQIEETPRRSKSRRGESFSHFVREETETIYRDNKGRFSKKKKRGAKLYKIRRLIVHNAATGKDELYGEVKEANNAVILNQKITRADAPREGLRIDDFLTNHRIPEVLKKNKARGVLISLRGKGRKRGEVRIKARVILNRKRLKDKSYLTKLITGKLRQAVADRGFRLSSLAAGGSKRKEALQKLTLKISYFY